MKLYLVTEDNGDGSTSIRKFASYKEAEDYILANEDWCWGNEGFPTVIDTDNIQFD